jgi:hypothetical protein
VEYEGINGTLSKRKKGVTTLEDENTPWIGKDTMPGFTVTCDKCKSTNVYLSNSLSYSEVSGVWGELSLVCNDCDNSIAIYEPLG